MKNYILKKSTFIIFILSIFIVNNSNLFAQNKKANETAQTSAGAGVISVNFVSGDVAFMYKAFNTVELKATEVDAFLMAQEKLKLIVENPNFQKLTTDVPVKVDMEVTAAEKLIMFANRITLNGTDVTRYKRFLNAIYEAAKALQK